MKGKRNSSFPNLFAGLLWLLAMVSACGDGAPESPEGPPASEAPSIPAENFTQAELKARKAEVFCNSPGSCHPSLAMLVRIDDNKVGTCTSFLVAPDLLATSSHCIPDDLRLPAADCSKRIWLHFPETPNHPAQREECANIVSASETTPEADLPDYAFLRLKRPITRPVIELDRRGFEASPSYYVAKIDPFYGNGYPQGYLRRDECRALADSLVSARAPLRNGSLVALGDCAIVRGNSGSPILDGRGRARGIIQATALKDNYQLKLGRLLLDPEIGDIGVGTNMACVPDPVGAASSELPFSCRNRPSNTLSDLESSIEAHAYLSSPAFLARVATGLTKALNADELGKDHRLQWTMHEIPSTSPLLKGRTEKMANYFIARPQCFRAPSTWIDEFEGYFGSFPEHARLSRSLPAWELRRGLNRNLQYDFRIRALFHRIEASVTFNPRALDVAGQSPVVLRATSLSSGKAALFNGDLEACPQD